MNELELHILNCFFNTLKFDFTTLTWLINDNCWTSIVRETVLYNQRIINVLLDGIHVKLQIENAF
jgi:hypothetical protein